MFEQIGRIRLLCNFYLEEFQNVENRNVYLCNDKNNFIVPGQALAE